MSDSMSKRVSRGQLADALGSAYLHYRGGTGTRPVPPLVLVHGRSRDVDSLFSAFLPWADRFGVDMLAPKFTVRRHHGYQRLGTSDRSRSAADVLDDILEDAGVGRARRIWLFGFSGGAQFAHRYAMVRRRRLAALSIAAAGWYTFPDFNVPYPYGLAPGSLPNGLSASLTDFLALPIQVLVGERDVERDSSLRRGRRVDRQQGPNRVTRALAWVEAVRRLVPDRDAPRLEMLHHVGHSFESCVQRARLVERVTNWFVSLLEDVSRAASSRPTLLPECARPLDYREELTDA